MRVELLYVAKVLLTIYGTEFRTSAPFSDSKLDLKRETVRLRDLALAINVDLEVSEAVDVP